LTADHGAANNASYNLSHRIPAGNLRSDSLKSGLQQLAANHFGNKAWIEEVANQEVYINHDMAMAEPVKAAQLKEEVIDYLRHFNGIADAVDLEHVQQSSIAQPFRDLISNTYNARRSGDVFFILQPAWMEGYVKGTTHGTMYPYDTHVPLIFMGANIKPGKDFSDIHVCDIAPTVASYLHIQEPNGCVGKPIQGLLK
jgi:hypothetical protein